MSNCCNGHMVNNNNMKEDELSWELTIYFLKLGIHVAGDDLCKENIMCVNLPIIYSINPLRTRIILVLLRTSSFLTSLKSTSNHFFCSKNVWMLIPGYSYYKSLKRNTVCPSSLGNFDIVSVTMKIGQGFFNIKKSIDTGKI